MISANIPTSTRKAIYRRDGYRCALCDSTQYLQIHHIIPRGKGGGRTRHPTLLSILLALSVNRSCSWHRNSRFVGLPRSGSTDCPKKRAIAS